MNDVKRNESIKLRVTLDEKCALMEQASHLCMPVNQYVLAQVFSSETWGTMQSKFVNVAKQTVEASNIINSMEHKYPEVDFTPIRKGVDKICQCLL